MQRIWEASEYLAVLLARYSRIEALYHRVQVSNAAELGDAIVNVYICILQYSAKVKQSVTSKRLGIKDVPASIVVNTDYIG